MFSYFRLIHVTPAAYINQPGVILLERFTGLKTQGGRQSRDTATTPRDGSKGGNRSTPGSPSASPSSTPTVEVDENAVATEPTAAGGAVAGAGEKENTNNTNKDNNSVGSLVARLKSMEKKLDQREVCACMRGCGTGRLPPELPDCRVDVGSLWSSLCPPSPDMCLFFIPSHAAPPPSLLPPSHPENEIPRFRARVGLLMAGASHRGGWREGGRRARRAQPPEQTRRGRARDLFDGWAADSGQSTTQEPSDRGQGTWRIGTKLKRTSLRATAGSFVLRYSFVCKRCRFVFTTTSSRYIVAR